MTCSEGPFCQCFSDSAWDDREKGIAKREAAIQGSNAVYQLLIPQKVIKNNVKRDTDFFFFIILNQPSLHDIMRPLLSDLNLIFMFFSRGIMH